MESGKPCSLLSLVEAKPEVPEVDGVQRGRTHDLREYRDGILGSENPRGSTLEATCPCKCRETEKPSSISLDACALAAAAASTCSKESFYYWDVMMAERPL